MWGNYAENKDQSGKRSDNRAGTVDERRSVTVAGPRRIVASEGRAGGGAERAGSRRSLSQGRRHGGGSGREGPHQFRTGPLRYRGSQLLAARRTAAGGRAYPLQAGLVPAAPGALRRSA